MYNISLLIGLKNNLEYSRSCYDSIRSNYSDIEIVFVSYGSTDGTHDWLESITDENLIYYFDKEEKTLSDTYNKAIEISTKEYICFLHNDMVLGRNFVFSLSRALERHNLVYYKVIEPPIFNTDKRIWKEILDFGRDFDSFKFTEFFEFENNQNSTDIVATEDKSFFLAAKKKILTKINGLDPLYNPMFCEDDDLILRLRMSGQKTFVCKNAMVYHFVSKTSRFSEEFKNKTSDIEQNSIRNFVRKWGFMNNSTKMEKRKFGLILKNPNYDAIKTLEIFVDHIYSNYNSNEYILEEQPKTIFDLKEKFKSTDSILLDDVIIKFDAKKLSTKNLHSFQNLSAIISEKKNEKKIFSFLRKEKYFKINNLQVEIIKDITYKQDLIIRENV
ncbi:glycosyltransferase family 2 protein [Chryseobacterium sp.]|uniref:glycosyltransferase family 2 protein n=1 Tax=Chryseobacterium sp. TaxID=1871047 RepID=UPI00388E2F46